MGDENPYSAAAMSMAESYERYFVPTIGSAVAGDLLDAAGLAAGDRVLDVATGTGLIARQAAERVGGDGEVVGVDLVPEMIAVAESIAPAAGAAPVHWLVGPAESLPLPDDTFDVVMCQMGLMFMQDREAALAEFDRVLSPGGRVAVSTPGRIQPPFERMDEAIAEHIDAGLAGFVGMVFSMADPEAVGRLLEGAGFERVRTSNPTVEIQLPPPGEFLWQYIAVTPLAGPVGNAPAAAKESLERDVVEGSRDFTRGGALVVDQPMVIATGRAAG